MDIRLVNLTKVFADKDSEVRAVDNLDTVIPSGKLIGLLGPSGCGKSTTLYMIAGLLNPTEGQIFFGNADVTQLPPEKRGIGLVFQNYALYPHMTVKQNILFPLQNLKVPKAEALQRAQKVADLVAIGSLMNRKPKQLSGGQQQRVAIARALVKNPDVLLLDEPLSNLDARLRLQTREEIKRIQRETGITTIFVTHDQEEAMSISDEIIVMKDGVAQQKGAPQEVYNNPVNLFVAKFLGTPPINVFKGYIKDGGVYIGEDRILETELPEQEVTIGIRPEGFEVNEDGTGDFTFKINLVEYIGRDKSVIAENEYCESPTFRFIVDADIKNIVDGRVIKAKIKPHKCFIFDKLTEKRLQ
ncbi:MAG: ABC transporter ATP-binding protein [Bacilli bacterium]|jgi:multiple sugar transport system ATP-binding protein